MIFRGGQFLDLWNISVRIIGFLSALIFLSCLFFCFSFFFLSRFRISIPRLREFPSTFAAGQLVGFWRASWLRSTVLNGKPCPFRDLNHGTALAEVQSQGTERELVRGLEPPDVVSDWSRTCQISRRSSDGPWVQQSLTLAHMEPPK